VSGLLRDIFTGKVIALPTTFTGYRTTAEIAVSPDGRFVYCSNHGHDSVTIYAVDPADGSLITIGWQPTHGRDPALLLVLIPQDAFSTPPTSRATPLSHLASTRGPESSSRQDKSSTPKPSHHHIFWDLAKAAGAVK